MKIRGFLKELHHRGVFKVAVAYTPTGIVVLEVVTHLFHNFEAPHWVLKVITTLLILGLPIACLMAWGFEFREGRVRTVPREPQDTKPALPGPEATAPAPSIAVLPFADMSADHGQQYLGDGIAEELLNALASIEGLNVAARTSSFSFAGKGASMKEIGESGFHLYSQSYDRQVQDIFDIQNEIAREIAGALLPRLGLGKDVVLVKHGTTNLEAYSLTLQARRWLTAPDPVTSSTAIEMLRRALALDPHYWDAWGDLAYIKGYMTSWNGDPVPLWVDAESAAMAADYYERARRAGVDQSLWAFQKAFCYDGTLGRFDAAIEELRDAARNDPLASSVKGAHASCWTDPAHLSGKITPAACSCSSRSTRRPRRHDSMVDQGRRATRDLDVDADGCAQSQSPSHREGPTLPCAAAADGARREQSVIANSRFAAAGLEREPP